MSAAEVLPDPIQEALAFKTAMRHLAAAVCVVTTERGEMRTGFTATLRQIEVALLNSKPLPSAKPIRSVQGLQYSSARSARNLGSDRA